VAPMEFCLLGPLLVRRDGIAVPLSPGKQRALLTALLLNANNAVPTGQLAEMLWEPDPPASARASLQNLVMRLRRALADADHSLIAGLDDGYLINVRAGELDIERFEAALAAAREAARRGSWTEAADLLRTALTLWRGEPLSGVPYTTFIHQEASRLAELRLEAVEAHIEADMRLGRHAEVLAELQQLSADHPLREHLHWLLMLALYRCSRRAEALAAFQQARAVLVAQLGLEPSAQLQKLQQQILAGDPVLEFPSAAGAATGAGQTGAAGGEQGTASDQALVVPRQLPAVVAQFTGRERELAALTAMLDQDAAAPGTVVISAIGGTAGVGKTALALHWAHQVADRFGDGQLYVNLRGFDSSGIPAAPDEAIRGFLDALGVPPRRIPPTPQAQTGLYRSLLAGRKMLLVLDNAWDEQQVRPLLPASPGSLVLVTSRNQLSGLAVADGARLLSLDVLTHEEAVQLLAARLGAARAGAEASAVSEIASLCGCLPLALTVAAARAAVRPGFALAAVAAELRDAVGRLDALDPGDPGSSLQAVFSWSSRHLSGESVRMFRLLGLHPGPDISIVAAASLAGTTQTQARRLMRELARAHLINEHIPGRYAFHDLLRLYAAGQARCTDSRADRREAIRRVLDHCLHTAANAARLLNPSWEPVVLAPPRPGAAPVQPASYGQALAWFEEEHQVLLAAVTLAAESGFEGHAWQLPWAMTPFLHTRGLWREWAATQRSALDAATRLGDAAAQAVSSRSLAVACTYLGDHDQARRHLVSSLTLHQQLGNRTGEAKIHQNLGMLAERQGHYADALRHAEQALRLYQAIGDKAAEAEALNNFGWIHCVIGDYPEARAFCRQALTLCREVGDRKLEGSVWDSLGYAEHRVGSFAEATTCYQHALSLFRETGDRFHEAETLARLGDTRKTADQPAEARQAWQQALEILNQLDHPDAGQVRAKLAATDEFAPLTGRGRDADLDV
jgi:DNA-binding SARP family transcriptional activator/Tfp pilus assembly protein PilF